MNYTMVTMQECCRDEPMHLSIVSEGNRYYVEMYREGDGDRTCHRRFFDELKEAYMVYEKLASWMVFGFYRYEDRAAFLETGTMP